MVRCVRHSSLSLNPFLDSLPCPFEESYERATDEETEQLLRAALEVGYRHIDTAQMYECEGVVGNVLHEFFTSGKLKREEVFVTTKLPPTANQPAVVFQCFQDQLKDLQLDYVDLYLIHSPCSTKCKSGSYTAKMYSPTTDIENDTSVNLTETWKELEKIYNLGLAKSIGLSNFNVDQIQRIYSTASVKPMNLQIEVHIYWPQKELITLCNSLNITVTAYGPIGCPGKKGTPGWPEMGPIDDPLVAVLSSKYQRTPAQILLRYLTQRNIIVVPKSTNAKRIRENFESSDFFLADEDIQALSEVETRHRFYCWPQTMRSHPEYPFTELLDQHF